MGIGDMQMSRSALLRRGAAGGAVGVAALAVPRLALAASDPESEQIGEIYQLQAAFHRAKTNQDIDLMMSLWAADGKLTNQNDPNSPYVGFDELRAFWLSSGSFTHRRFSLVPSFKTQIDVTGTTRGCTSSATTSATTTWPLASSRTTRSSAEPSATLPATGSSRT